MNYFFGFDYELTENIEWSFNMNHIIVDIFAVLVVVISCFLFSARSEIGKKITKIFLSLFMFCLETGRMVYSYLRHLHWGGTNDNFDFIGVFSFQMCAIMCWACIITLFLSAILKKDNKFLSYLYNIIFGCGMIGAGVVFIAPSSILYASRPFFHFMNIQTFMVHCYLIFVPIYFVLTKDFKVELKNVWKVFVGYGYIGSLAMSMALISGHNFACCLSLDVVDLGIRFPFHLPVMLALLFLTSLIIYSIFEFIRYKRNKNISKEKAEFIPSKLTKITYLGFVLSISIFPISLLIGIAYILGCESFSIKGLICFIPLIYMLVLIFLSEDFKKYFYNPFDRDKKIKHYIIIGLLLILDLPVSVLYLLNYKKQ